MVPDIHGGCGMGGLTDQKGFPKSIKRALSKNDNMVKKNLSRKRVTTTRQVAPMFG